MVPSTLNYKNEYLLKLVIILKVKSGHQHMYTDGYKTSKVDLYVRIFIFLIKQGDFHVCGCKISLSIVE